jgi:hypothetical protein
VRAIDGTVGNVLVWPPIRTAIVFRCIILHSCVSTIRSGLYSYLSHISHREMPPAAGPRLLSLSPDERIVPCVPYEVICAVREASSCDSYASDRLAHAEFVEGETVKRQQREVDAARLARGGSDTIYIINQLPEH